MAHIIYTPADEAVARQLEAEISATDNTVILLVSSALTGDSAALARMEQALDADKRIVPVRLADVRLPSLIEHLDAVDFTQGADAAALQDRLDAEASRLHMKVHTSSVQNANKRFGVIVTVAAVIMFLAGIYGVGVLGINVPQEEYDAVETEIIETRNAYVDAALPHSTEDALNFEVTLEHAAPTLRPILSATVTAIAGQ